MLSLVIGKIPDENSELEMIGRFDRLIKKYARLLGYEDAYNDILVFFLELLLSPNVKKLVGKPDAVIVNYIAKAIRNEYIRLSKLNSPAYITYSELSDSELHIMESQLSYVQSDPVSWMLDNAVITAWERDVLLLIYEYNLSAREVAELTHKSRQAINQTKLHALNKLKGHYRKDRI